MVGVAGGGVGSASGPIRKAGGGGGVLSVYGPIRKAGRGEGGGAVGFWPKRRAGGGGGGAVGFWPKTKSGGWGAVGRRAGGGGGGGYDRISGGPGYSTVVEFMRADIFPLGLLSRSCSSWQESCPKTFCWDQTLNIHHCMHELLPHNKGYVLKVQVLL